MNAVLEAAGLTKRYGAFAALRDCHLALPARRVIGLVGPNGAGKTTLLQLAAGLRKPTAGSLTVLGRSPWPASAASLAEVGFVAQERPLYGDLTVDETLELGRRLNDAWDHAYAAARLRRFRIPSAARVRRLSTGQRAQVSLALALAKHPRLLLLDEPVANLDPLARLELLEELMAAVADGGPSVVMSANALADVERVCEHVVLLVDGRVRLAGDLEDLVSQHVFVSGPRGRAPFGDEWEVIDQRTAERQATWLLRGGGAPPIAAGNGTVARQATLEEIVLAYLRAAGTGARS